MPIQSVHARVILLLLLAAPSGACKRGSATSCREDVDCRPGFDCVATTCVQRQRLRFGPDARPAPPDASVAAATVPPPPDAGSPASVDTPPARPEAPPARLPAPATTPPADQPRLPLWKERLKNS